MSIIDTLEQTEWWFGEDGYPHRLTEMEQKHRINVIRMLWRRAAQLYERSIWREEQMLINAPDEVLHHYEAQRARELPASPEEWLRSRPLFQELQRLIRRYDAIDAEVLELPRRCGVFVRRIRG